MNTKEQKAFYVTMESDSFSVIVNTSGEYLTPAVSIRIKQHGGPLDNGQLDELILVLDKIKEGVISGKEKYINAE